LDKSYVKEKYPNGVEISYQYNEGKISSSLIIYILIPANMMKTA